jgi:hypothetical protein
MLEKTEKEVKVRNFTIKRLSVAFSTGIALVHNKLLHNPWN